MIRFGIALNLAAIIIRRNGTFMEPDKQKTAWLGRLKRCLVTLLAVVIAIAVVPGVEAESPAVVVAAGVLLSLAHEFIRPALYVLTLPLMIVTLSLFRFIINTALLGVVAAMIPGLQISGFWAAFFGALLISIITSVLNPTPREKFSFQSRAQWMDEEPRAETAKPGATRKATKSDTGDGPIIDV